jgi:PBSX family phage terminase large subunit
MHLPAEDRVIDTVFKAWGPQGKILRDKKRQIAAVAGKRAGKTEIGAIKAITYQETQPNIKFNGKDPYLGVIIAPTFDMLRRLAMRKFMIYGAPMIQNFNKSTNEITWHDGSLVYGLSAEKPERIEGLKANWIWLDEIFQMNEHLYLECRARLADTKGYLLATGSLGTNIVNPRLHWAYKYFKQKPDENTSCYEWTTKDNPHFPQDELESLRDKLDPQDFRAMFEIHWDTTPKSAVYHNFTDDNILQNYAYNPQLPTYVSIDWGWAHPMAALFFQVDWKKRVVYLFDEIVASQMTIEKLYNQIMAKPYQYKDWCCDIAGNQEREQSGRSNIAWFADKHIHFKQRRTAINYGIPILRSLILNGRGERKLYIAANCVKSIDGVKQYHYPEKNGQVTNEMPIKKDDDVVDALRYFVVNFMDENLSTGPSMGMLT